MASSYQHQAILLFRMTPLSDRALERSSFWNIWQGSQNCSTMSFRRYQTSSLTPKTPLCCAKGNIQNQVKTPHGTKFLKFQKRRRPSRRTLRQTKSNSSMHWNFLALTCITSSRCIQMPDRKLSLSICNIGHTIIRHLAWRPEIFYFLLYSARSKELACGGCFVI